MSLQNWIVLTTKKGHKVVAVFGPKLKELAYKVLPEYEIEGKPVNLWDMYFARQPKLGETLALCCYCNAKVGKNGLDIDGDAAHKNCHKKACE